MGVRGTLIPAGPRDSERNVRTAEVTPEAEGPRPPAWPGATVSSAATLEPAVCTRGGEYKCIQIARDVAAVRIRPSCGSSPLARPRGCSRWGSAPQPPQPRRLRVQRAIRDVRESEVRVPPLLGGLCVHRNSHRPTDTWVLGHNFWCTPAVCHGEKSVRWPGGAHA